MASFEAETRWALTTTVSDHFLQIMHIIVDHNTMYNRAKLGTD